MYEVLPQTKAQRNDSAVVEVVAKEALTALL